MSIYNIIYADPGWQYRDKANSGKRGVAHKYTTSPIEQIKQMNVAGLAAPNCALFMWAVFPMLPDCLSVMSSWGLNIEPVLLFGLRIILKLVLR